MQQVRFGWDNEFPSLSVEVPAFAIDVHDVTNAEYRAFVDAGGYDDAAWWSAAAWRRRRGDRSRAPVVLGTFGRRLVLARHVRPRAAAARLAGLRDARRGEAPSRAGRGSGCRPKPSTTGPPSERRTDPNGRTPGAMRRRMQPGATSTSVTGIRCRWAPSRRVRAPGECTISPATAGNGRPRRSPVSPASRRWPRIRSYSADFFDGEHFVVKGGVACHRARSRAPQLPELVPARTIRTRTRLSAAPETRSDGARSGIRPPGADSADGSRRGTRARRGRGGSRVGRSAWPRSITTMRSGHVCSRLSASSPW